MSDAIKPIISELKDVRKKEFADKIATEQVLITDNNICEEAISFIYDNKEYSYEYKFDDKK